MEVGNKPDPIEDVYNFVFLCSFIWLNLPYSPLIFKGWATYKWPNKDITYYLPFKRKSLQKKEKLEYEFKEFIESITLVNFGLFLNIYESIGLWTICLHELIKFIMHSAGNSHIGIMFSIWMQRSWGRVRAIFKQF